MSLITEITRGLDALSRSVAHLGAISGGQEVERNSELEADLVTPAEVARCEDEGMWSFTKLSAAMAMAPLPSEGARDRQSEWENAGRVQDWCGILDGIDNLTGGANTGVLAPNGSRCCVGRPRRRTELL